MISNLWHRFMALVAMLWREVAKFGAVGAAAFVVDSAIFLWLMNGPMEGSNVKSKLVASAVATVFSYIANRLWTFRHRRQNNLMREFVLFVVMNLIGMGIQAGCVFVAQYWMGITSTTGLFIAGNVIGLFLGTVFRFFAYRFWVFTEELDADPKFKDDRERLTGELPVIRTEGTPHRHRQGPGTPRSPASPVAQGPSAPSARTPTEPL